MDRRGDEQPERRAPLVRRARHLPSREKLGKSLACAIRPDPLAALTASTRPPRVECTVTSKEKNLQQRGKDRSRSWLSTAPWLLILVLGCGFAYWIAAREPNYRALSYGEFLQVLAAARANPGLALQKVQVNHGDIRGEIISTDPASDGADNRRHVTTVPFRTLRAGLETDLDLTRRLEAVGAAFQGGEEDSALRSFFSLLSTILMLGLFTVLLLFVMRWVSGGGSPFSFGRSRAKLYAQKDTKVTFQDVAGIDEAVAELREVVDFLKTPDK